MVFKYILLELPKCDTFWDHDSIPTAVAEEIFGLFHHDSICWIWRYLQCQTANHLTLGRDTELFDGGLLRNSKWNLSCIGVVGWQAKICVACDYGCPRLLNIILWVILEGNDLAIVRRLYDVSCYDRIVANAVIKSWGENTRMLGLLGTFGNKTPSSEARPR